MTIYKKSMKLASEHRDRTRKDISTMDHLGVLRGRLRISVRRLLAFKSSVSSIGVDTGIEEKLKSSRAKDRNGFRESSKNFPKSQP